MSAVELAGVPRDLPRILALPQRKPLDCGRYLGNDGKRAWAPEAQALIDNMTAKFARPRISCACRDRTVVAQPNGNLLVFHQNRLGQPPPPPMPTTVELFCRDSAHDPAVVQAVQRLRAGEKAELPGLGHPVCATQLNPAQAWVLRELPRAGGAFGMISIGLGKTFMSILAPIALEVRTVALFIKPDQRLHYRNAYLRLREHFRVPSVVFDGGGGGLQGSYIVSGTPVLHVIPYSLLSNPKSTALLEMLDPDAVGADEFHLLSNRTSSRTLRFLRFMSKPRPVSKIFFGWSGSAVKKSIKDASHLAAHALGLGSPYPILPEEVEAWSAVMDPSPLADRASQTAADLRRAFGAQIPDERKFVVGLLGDAGIREGFRDRVVRTPGVISTKSSEVNCSITIKERKVADITATMREKLSEARQGRRGDGEELAEQMEIIACARAAAAGYFHHWVYKHPCACPPSPVLPERRCVDCKLIDDWFEKRKRWNKELRSKLLNGEVNLDSRKLCESAAERAWRQPPYGGELPVWPAQTWLEWAEIKDRVNYEERTKIFDDFLARDAAAWAQEHRGIVWVQAPALGRKIAELAGINYHGGGNDAEARILAESGAQSIVASMRSHSEGRDGLQYKFYKQLLVELPASADRYEQLFGRLARQGQEADTIETWMYQHVSEYREALAKAIMLAEFIEETTPNQQLLLAADIEFDV